MADATIKGVYDFFKSTYSSLAQFRKDWDALSETDKAQLKAGIGDGTLTY